MRVSLTAALTALLLFAGCQTGDSAGDASAEAPAQEQAADDLSAVAGSTEALATTEAACEPERAQDIPSPGRCAALALGTARVEVQYGGPFAKGREVFGGLVPYAAVWRTGANEATVFETDAPLAIGGDTLAAGSYGLFTIPGETEWTVIFNAVPDQWGAFDYDAAQDVLRVEATPETATAPQEQFSISFDRASDTDASMVMEWADVRVSVPLALGR